MKRREFILMLGGAASSLARPVAVEAQQAKVSRIGVLVVANPEPFSSMFREALRDLGYIEGQNLQIEFRSAEGKSTALPGLADEFVRLKVDAIIAVQTPCVQAAKQATKDIPIIMAPAADPVGTGLIASLARPGGNVTGLSFVTPDLQGKNLELMHEMLPAMRRVTFLGDVADANAEPFLNQTQVAGRVLSVEVNSIMVKGSEAFEPAFAEMIRQHADAVIVQPSLPRKPIADLALQNHLPAISPNRGFPESGGLMSYSGSLAEVYRKVAVYLDKIIKGGKPADMPVEQPTKFELVINLKTAKALGLDVPPSLRVRADQMIE
jgi:putative ABC transport system substrate-binding protein